MAKIIPFPEDRDTRRGVGGDAGKETPSPSPAVVLDINENTWGIYRQCYQCREWIKKRKWAEPWRCARCGWES